jgi:hypothetical protein
MQWDQVMSALRAEQGVYVNELFRGRGESR